MYAQSATCNGPDGGWPCNFKWLSGGYIMAFLFCFLLLGVFVDGGFGGGGQVRCDRTENVKMWFTNLGLFYYFFIYLFIIFLIGWLFVCLFVELQKVALIHFFFNYHYHYLSISSQLWFHFLYVCISVPPLAPFPFSIYIYFLSLFIPLSPTLSLLLSLPNQFNIDFHRHF